MTISSSIIFNGKTRLVQMTIFALVLWPLFSMEDQGFIPRPVVFLKAQDARHIWIKQWPFGQVAIVPLAGCRESKRVNKKKDLYSHNPTTTIRLFSNWEWADVRSRGLWHPALAEWGRQRLGWVCSPRFSRARWQKTRAAKIPYLP